MKRFLKKIYVAFRKAFNDLSNPPIVAIELTNRCNAKCIMCWRDEVKREHDSMPFADFISVVQKTANAGARVYQLSFFGESTLYKQLPEAIHYIKTNVDNSFVTVNTNAYRLDQARAKALIDSGIDQISISIDGNNAREFESIRIGLRYDTVRENVKSLWELVQSTSRSVNIQIRGLNLASYPLDEKTYQANWQAFAHKVISRDEHDLCARKQEPLLHKLLPCNKMFSQSIVLVDGETTVCAYDWHGTNTVGNLVTDPIDRVWKSWRWRFYKLLHLLGLKKTVPVCRDCTYQMFPY